MVAARHINRATLTLKVMGRAGGTELSCDSWWIFLCASLSQGPSVRVTHVILAAVDMEHAQPRDTITLVVFVCLQSRTRSLRRMRSAVRWIVRFGICMRRAPSGAAH